MQKYTIAIIFLFFITCTKSFKQGSLYTEEQIKSLYLDSTNILTVRTDSLENINLNSFLNLEDFDFESLIDDIFLIPLETVNESLLDVIYKIIVTDSNIYIYDRLKGGGIVFFDNKGKFIRRIPYGQGPGEINKLYDISYDFEKRELLAYQHPFLLFYTSKGEFIGQKRLPFGFYNFSITPNGYIFKTLDDQGNEHIGELKYHTFFVTDKEFKLNTVALPFYLNNINYGGYNYLYNHDNHLKVTQRFVDTIYQYEHTTNQLYAKYALNFDKKKLPDKYLRGSMNEFKNAINNYNYYYYIGEYFETEHHNAFFLMNNYIGLKTIIYRDKESKNLIGGTRGTYDDKNQIPPMGFPIATYRDYFVSCYYPSESDSLFTNSSFLSDIDKKTLKNKIEDDNPILVFFKLKSFK